MLFSLQLFCFISLYALVGSSCFTFYFSNAKKSRRQSRGAPTVGRAMAQLVIGPV